ncbi:MAG: DUF11 domain-containing protein [Anaerolineae bacterium]|nr:DUF11 domain-containing protein [Anaerolineae bacterium]
MKKYGLMLIILVSLLSAVFIGLDYFNSATADDAIDVQPLDIAVVFDASGSMQYETTCFDCWEPNGADVIANPWPANGVFNPLPDTTTAGLCTENLQYIVDPNGNKYSVHEAELYSRDVPLHGWEFDKRTPGQGFWVIQRLHNMDASGTDSRGAFIRAHPYAVYSQYQLDNYPQLQGGAYNNECFNGPNLSGACWATTAALLGETPPSNNPPYVEYDFTPGWSGNTHVWIRAQGAYNYSWKWLGQSPVTREFWQRALFWQLGPADGSNWSDVQGRDFTNLDYSRNYDFPQNDHWRWLKLGDIPTTQGTQHTLRLYQGSAGFNIDKVMFTNFSGGVSNTTIAENGTVYGDSSGINTTFKNMVNQNSGKGPDATKGSATREACNVCNPVFGQTVDIPQCSCKTSKNDNTASSYGAGGAGVGCTQVLTDTNQLTNDLYHDIDPIRSAKEAVKNFAIQLDPKIDQLGLVAYSSNVKNGTTNGIKQRVELQCLTWAETNDLQGIEACYQATNAISYTDIMRSVEIHNNNGSTNIGDGMHEGLIELGIDTVPERNIDHECRPPINDGSVCDRQGTAQRILILMTDGVPNAYNSGCPASNVWTGTFGQGNRAFDCAIFYAQQAAENDVALFTIGMGPAIYPDLLTAMATGTDPTTGDVYFDQNCGAFFPVANLNTLDDVFDEIEQLARNCPQPTLDPQISSTNGYILPQSSQLMAHLIDHQGIPHDIYLSDADGATYPICLNVLPGGDDPACALDAVPPGGYELYSVIAGSQNPRVAVAPELVIVVADTSAPQILSLSGYDTIQTAPPFQVHLENHPAGFSYDIYLKSAASAFKICSNLTANVMGRVEATCSLAGIPPGLYNLVSVVAKTINPSVAVSERQVEVIGDPAPLLAIRKQGPATAAPDELITYTLTVTNSGSISATNLILTDTLPAGASYVSGGTKIGNVIRWSLLQLEPDETAARSFRVTATQTITNNDYGVTSDGGYQAIGLEPVTTIIEPSPLPITCLDPLADQSFELSPSEWTVAFDQGVTRSAGQANSGNFKLSASSFEGFPTNPWFYQTFTVPTWLTASNTSLHLTLHKNINALADGNQPDDKFFAVVTADPSSLASALANKVTTPTVVADGVMPSGVYDPTNWEKVSLSLPLLDENLVETYKGQPLSLYLYNKSNSQSACSSGFCATDFFFDDIKLDFCGSKAPYELYLPLIVR